MADYQLPDPSTFRSISDQEKSIILTHLFEKSSALEQIILPIFSMVLSYKELICECRKVLLSLTAEAQNNSEKKTKLVEILAAHPRLGARKVDSVHSAAEQASLQGETTKLAALNEEYEKKFPGLRYVVFVNGRSRETIMANMRKRIDGDDYTEETIEAANAMCDIAFDRAKKLGVE
ncbi:putative allantoinase 1 [Dipodascopsis uninucleata]